MVSGRRRGTCKKSWDAGRMREKGGKGGGVHIHPDAFSVKHVSLREPPAEQLVWHLGPYIRVPNKPCQILHHPAFEKRCDEGSTPPRKYSKVAGVSTGHFPQLHVDFPLPMEELAIIYPVPKWILYRVILDLLFVGSSRRFYHDWVSAVGLFVQPCFAFAARGQRMFLLYLEPMSNAFRSSILNAFSGGRRVGMWIGWGTVGWRRRMIMGRW